MSEIVELIGNYTYILNNAIITSSAPENCESTKS